jgi:hypothetical protein
MTQADAETILLMIAGKMFQMDAEDSDVLNIAKKILINANGYATVRKHDNTNVTLHRLILSKHHDIGDMIVHHRDGNKCNNKKSNLFITNQTGNSKGKSKQSRSKKKYKGYVTKRTSYGQTYPVTIGVNYKRIHVGTYSTEEEAAIAYDLAALKYYGKDLAILNFRDKDYSQLTLEGWQDLKGLVKRPGKWSLDKRGGLSGLTVECCPKLPDELVDVSTKCDLLQDQPKTKTVVTIVEMSRMVGLSNARFRQLIGSTFPCPLYTETTHRPYYTEDMQLICLEVRRRNLGIDGQPVFFYTPREEKNSNAKGNNS